MIPFVKAIIDGYAQEQRDLIAEESVKAVNVRNCDFERTMDIRQYRNADQWFAVFGTTAREISAFTASDEKKAYEYLPAFTEEGEAIAREPWEGRSGILHLLRQTAPVEGEWFATYLDLGWIHTKDLELTPRQIMENVVADYDDGKLHV